MLSFLFGAIQGKSASAPGRVVREGAQDVPDVPEPFWESMTRIPNTLEEAWPMLVWALAFAVLVVVLKWAGVRLPFTKKEDSE